MIWAFIYSNLIGNSIGLNICGMWVLAFKNVLIGLATAISVVFMGELTTPISKLYSTGQKRGNIATAKAVRTPDGS
jgi:hypothetical protein